MRVITNVVSKVKNKRCLINLYYCVIIIVSGCRRECLGRTLTEDLVVMGWEWMGATHIGGRSSNLPYGDHHIAPSSATATTAVNQQALEYDESQQNKESTTLLTMTEVTFSIIIIVKFIRTKRTDTANHFFSASQREMIRKKRVFV